ncbi:hypothetical protein SESBI_13401 [Sesbania bispinosa]|nr:hypothetical protein SESBI_13401 [Sesbania bispinosa]
MEEHNEIKNVEDSLKQVGDDNSRVDQLRDLVKLLASVVVNNKTVLSPSQSATSLQLLATSCLTPTKTTGTKDVVTEDVMQAVSALAKTLTQSAPTKGIGTSQVYEKMEDMNLARKLFTEQNDAQNFDHYINYNPLQSSMFSGKKS